MKELDVIVPCYKSPNILNKTLLSIASQTIINLCDVLLVNDNPKIDYSDLVEKYKSVMSIKQIKTSGNIKTGLCRQFGIDNSKNKYIVFIDDDDYFYNSCALEKMLSYINRYNADCIQGDVVRIENDKENILDKSILLHGKIFRRSTLEKYNISFRSELTNCEDVYFVGLINKLNKRLLTEYFVSDKFYIWNRTNVSYNFENKDSGIRSHIYNIYVNQLIYEKLISLGIENNKNDIIFDMLVSYSNFYEYLIMIYDIDMTKKLLHNLSVFINKFYDKSAFDLDAYTKKINNTYYLIDKNEYLNKMLNGDIYSYSDELLKRWNSFSDLERKDKFNKCEKLKFMN